MQIQRVYEFTCFYSGDPHHLFILFLSTLQQKNTCAHNNSAKAHRRGIKKKARTLYVSTKGMDPKFLRNQKYAKRYNKSKRVKSDE